MGIYVDRLVNYGWRLGPSCHLTADTTEELHTFAAKLGLKRTWCSDRTQPSARPVHYDLVASKRGQALKLGAEDITEREHEVYTRLRKLGHLGTNEATAEDADTEATGT